MQTFSRFVFLCAAAVLCFGLGACNQNPDPAATPAPGGGGAAPDKKLTIACVPKGTAHSYWKAVEAGARRAAGELGVNLEWQGALDDSKVADQIGIVNNLAASGVDGLILAPSDDKALAPHVRNIVKRGIPVIVIDSPLDGKVGVDYAGFVATDNRQAGVMAARELLRQVGTNLPNGGNMLMIRFTEGSASTRYREEGFKSAVTLDNRLKIVAEQFTDGSMAGAQRVAEALLGNHVNNNRLELDAIFAPNQPSAEGTCNALKSLRDKGVQVDAKYVGFDTSDLLLQGLNNGIIQALVVQDPDKMGYLGVRQIVDAINKRPVPAYTDTGITIKTKADDRS